MRKVELWVYPEDLKPGDKVLDTHKLSEGSRVHVEREVPNTPKHLSGRYLEHSEYLASGIHAAAKQYLGQNGDPYRLIITTSPDPSSFRVQITTEGWTKK